VSAALPAVAQIGFTLALPRVSLRFIPSGGATFSYGASSSSSALLNQRRRAAAHHRAFGYGLGSLLPQIEGVTYLQFLATGSIAMSVMYSAKFEALWGAFSRYARAEDVGRHPAHAAFRG